MWQERFEEMQVKVDSFLIGYKSDFEIDKKTITEAPQDTFLWMLRKTGTQMVNLTEVEIRAPKLYFCDTGLAAYLTSWNNPEALETGAMSNEFFATWVVMEIYKSYTNNGLVPPLYYLRNFNGKELDLIIYENGIAYPVAISKSTLPNKMLKTFAILTPVANDAQIKIGEGAIICFADGLIKASENISYVPAWMI